MSFIRIIIMQFHILRRHAKELLYCAGYKLEIVSGMAFTMPTIRLRDLYHVLPYVVPNV